MSHSTIGTVFISHKVNGSDVALGKIIADFMRNESGNRVRVFFSSNARFRTPQIGRTLDEELRDALGETGVVVLVYTGMSQEVDWSYCMYECGYATSRAIPVHVFQCRDEAPSPLAHLVRVKVDSEEDIKKFVTEYLTSMKFFPKQQQPVTGFSPEDPIIEQKARYLRDQLVAEVAAARAKEAQEKETQEIRSNFVVPQLCFKVASLETLHQGSIPDNLAVILDQNALSMLRLTERTSWDWGTIRNQIKSSATSWQRELGRAIGEAAEGFVPKPITATFRIHDSGKIFRPILYKVDLLRDRVVSCHVLINQETAPEEVGGAEGPDFLFRMLRLGTRFESEIIVHFLDRLNDWRGIEDPILMLIQLKDSISAIEVEERVYRVDRLEFVNRFFGADEGNTLRNIYAQWDHVISDIDRLCAERSTDAFPRASEQLRTALEKLSNLNKEYMAITARQYASLLGEKATGLPPQ